MHRSFLSLLVFGYALLFAAPLHAQEQPSFAIPQIITPEEVKDLSVDFDEAFSSIDNAYLSDSIKLNYQISLLEKMVARQSQMEKITESYQALGVAFDEPAPPRGICAQLPANGPCLKFYPDLYENLVRERKAYYDDLAEKARAALAAASPETIHSDDPEAAAKAKRAAEEKRRKEEEAERKSRYQWTDITCRGRDCRGVLTHASQSGYRVTVREGDSLPDGTVIKAVSADGINISIKGDFISVRPAPGETAISGMDGPGAGIAGALADSGIDQGALISADSLAAGTSEAQRAASDIIANAGAAATQAGATNGGTSLPPAPAQAPMPPVSGSQTAAEPPLGPSGLF